MKFSYVALGAFSKMARAPIWDKHSWFQSSVTPIVAVSLHLGKAPCCNWLFHWVHHLLSSGSPLSADLCLHLFSLSGLSSAAIKPTGQPKELPVSADLFLLRDDIQQWWLKWEGRQNSLLVMCYRKHSGTSKSIPLLQPVTVNKQQHA